MLLVGRKAPANVSIQSSTRLSHARLVSPYGGSVMAASASATPASSSRQSPSNIIGHPCVLLERLTATAVAAQRWPFGLQAHPPYPLPRAGVLGQDDGFDAVVALR